MRTPLASAWAKELPMPIAVAPASNQDAASAAPMPPVGTNCTWGATAIIARRKSGPRVAAGNSLTVEQPCCAAHAEGGAMAQAPQDAGDKQ